MAKMNNKWITLCSAAIGVIYSAGYVVTETASPANAQAAAKAPTSQVNNSGYQNGYSRHHHHDWDSDGGNDSWRGTYTTPQQGNSSQGSSPTQNSVPAATNSKTTYKDGTYTGTGMNRYGTVQVSVAINNGKISSVQITDCQTHYPESDISSLPQEVVANQSWNVDIVSGATGSSEDFRSAVQDALQKAKNA